MNKFKNSITAKAVAGFVGLAVVAIMAGPLVASAMEMMTTSMTSSYVFTKTLKSGVTDQEVMNLQTVLNSSADTMVSESGVGSKGMETKYFGAKTKAAVVKFQEKYASDILVPNGLTKGTGLVGASTRAKLNGMGGMMSGVPGCTSTTGFSMTTGASCAGSTGGTVSMVPGCTSTTGYSPTTGAPCSSSVVTTATGTGAVSAMIDPSSVMSGSVIKGASTKVAIFKLTNGGSAAVKVTGVKMKRTGVSSDNTFRNVYLYNGAMRITDSASVASGMINFTDASGIVTIPAMSSISLGVMVEVDNSLTTNTGETLGVMLTDVMTDSGTVSGLPLSGAQQTVVPQPSGMTTVSFGGTTIPGTSNVDPQVDYVVWQNTVQVGSRDALVSSLRFRQIGSVSAGDLKNFRLMVDGVQVGSAVEMVNSNQYVEFNFATPITIKSGGRTVKLVADIIGGSNKNFAFSIQQSVDAMFWDGQLGVVVAPVTLAPAGNGSVFSAVFSATQNVNQGTLTITKTTDSPSGNIVLQGSNVTLAKFTFKAAGEKLKIENIRVAVTSYTGGATYSTLALRNGALYVNGSQIGSTAAINGTSTTAAYTQFNLGSSLIVEPGQNVTVEVRGDVYNNGTTQLAANDTFVVGIVGGSANVYKMSSYGYLTNSAVSGNTVTVASGSMTVAKATSYANQVVTVPQTAFKVGEFNVTTGSTEALNLNQFTLDFTGSTDVTKLQDVYVVYGSKTTVVKSTVSTTSNTFSVNEQVAAGATMSVKVYSTLNSNAVGSVTANLKVDATSQASGNSATGNVNGQTITVGTGTLTATVDASTPVSVLVVGGSMPKVGSFKFTASNDAFTIVDLTATTTDSSSIIELVFKDGATELGRQPFNGTTLTKTGLNVAVLANTNKVIDVYANLGSVGTNAGATGGNIGVALTSYKYRNSNGVETATSSFTGTGVASSLVANPMYVYKTKPTISNVALPSTVLNSGTMTVYQFSVAADAGGTVSWRQLKLAISATGVGFSTINIYDSANQSTPLTGVTVATTSSAATFTSSIDQEVSGSKTYVVKAFITGSPVAGNSFAVSIPNSGLGFVAPTAAGSVGATASFIWSDQALTPHTNLTNDWNNDYLVKNLPTDSLTLTK